MMSLEAFKLRDYHLAGWDQRVPFLVRESARHEDLGKARIGSSFLGRIVRSSDDQVVNHLSGVLNAIGGDSAAMSVAQEEAACLRKLNRIGGFGDAGAQKEEHGGCNSKTWTHEKLPSSTSPNVEHLRGQFVPATVYRQLHFCRLSSVSFFGHSWWHGTEAPLHVLNAQRDAHQRLGSWRNLM